MLYSSEKKSKIILENFNQPSHQVELEKLKKISKSYQVPWATFQSLEAGCGDIIHLLMIKKENYLEKCLFSAQQSCLITIATANIICSCIEKKSIDFTQSIINNCERMIKKENYDLENCPDLKVFSDISQFPHRIECLKIVLRGMKKILLNYSN